MRKPPAVLRHRLKQTHIEIVQYRHAGRGFVVSSVQPQIEAESAPYRLRVVFEKWVHHRVQRFRGCVFSSAQFQKKTEVDVPNHQSIDAVL